MSKKWQDIKEPFKIKIDYKKFELIMNSGVKIKSLHYYKTKSMYNFLFTKLELMNDHERIFFTDTLLEADPKKAYIETLKFNYNLIRKKIGVSVPVYKSYINKMKFKMYQIPDKYVKLIMPYLYDPIHKRISYQRLENYIKHKEIINQYFEDGNNHLIDFALSFLLTTKDMKLRFGKQIWKIISTNSKHRNRLLLSMSTSVIEKKSMHIYDEDFIRLFLIINQFSSSYLKNFGGSAFAWEFKNNPDRFAYHENILRIRKKLSHKPSYHTRQVINIYGDTMSMCKQLNVKFRAFQDFEKLLKLHDLCKKLTFRANYNDNEIKWLRNVPKLKFDGVKIEILNTPLQINLLGNQEAHCIGSYAKDVGLMYKMVIKLTDEETQEIGSLSLNSGLLSTFDKSNKFRIGQFYAKRNSKVISEKLIACKVMIGAYFSKEENIIPYNKSLLMHDVYERLNKDKYKNALMLLLNDKNELNKDSTIEPN